MNVSDDYFYLGKITKLHAYEGKLVFFLDTDEPQKYAGLKMVFIAGKEGMIPYFLEEINLQNNKAIVKIQDIDSVEKAEPFVGKALYLPVNMLPPLTGNRFYYHEIIGYDVTDEVFGTVGTVKAVLEYPNQAVIQVFHGEKEVLVPVNDEVIKEVDRNNKQIKVKMPEGLLDIYLEL